MCLHAASALKSTPVLSSEGPHLTGCLELLWRINLLHALYWARLFVFFAIIAKCFYARLLLLRLLRTVVVQNASASYGSMYWQSLP